MTLDPITIQKTLDERLEEYSGIFRETSGLEVKEVWSDFVTLDLGSKTGWQAFWKIPRVTCDSLEIQYPTVVFVEVEEVNSNDLTASIRIVAVEDDVELPEQHEAMLIHVYPTVQQQDLSLCIFDIAQCLDSLRFFYNHIWQPWDEEADKNKDWVLNSLIPRMKLFRDMQAGQIDLHAVSYIRHLHQEARSLYEHKSLLEMKVQESQTNCLSNDQNIDDTLRKNVALELMEIQQQLNRVLHDIAVIEMTTNPFLRKKVIEHRQKGQKTYQSLDAVQYFVVWHGDHYEEYLDLMSKALAVIPQNAKIKPCDFKTALEQINEGDTIFLCQGLYEISDYLNFRRSGTVKGFPCASDVTLRPGYHSSSLFDWRGGKLILDNLSLSGEASVALLIIRSGVMNVSCCRFISNSLKMSTTGVCLMPGSVAELTDCQLCDLDAGITVHAGATLRLVRCKITSCKIGIQMHSGAEVYLKECSIKNCSEYGLVFRATDNKNDNIVGSLQLLNRLDGVVVEGTKLEDNANGDVFVSPLSNSNSLLDLKMETEGSPISSSNPVCEN